MSATDAQPASPDQVTTSPGAGAAPQEVGPSPAEALSARLVEAAAGTMDLFSIYVGEQLGLYRSLVEDGPATAPELAGRTGMQERYAREWLEQQATTGLLTVDDPSREASARRFDLPQDLWPVLVDQLSPMYLRPLGRVAVSALRQAPALLDAYRRGGGVPWSAYGEDMRTGQAEFNRPFFLGDFVPGYLAQVPGVDEALRRPGARVAEIGPGGGWAAVGITQAYPEVSYDGFEIDLPSVELARAAIADAGLASRARIHHQDAADTALDARFDLVCALECIHDMPDPVGVLTTMRRLAGPSGTVLVMDERVAREFGAVGDQMERLFYGFSLTVCLPDGLSTSPSVGTGTVMRPSVLEGYARAAGFSALEVLPLEHPAFRFYRLLP